VGGGGAGGLAWFFVLLLGGLRGRAGGACGAVTAEARAVPVGATLRVAALRAACARRVGLAAPSLVARRRRPRGRRGGREGGRPLGDGGAGTDARRGGVQKKNCFPVQRPHPAPSSAHTLRGRTHADACSVHVPNPRRPRAGAPRDSPPRHALPPVHVHVAHEPIPGRKPRVAQGTGEGALPPVDVAHVLVPVATRRGGARCNQKETTKAPGTRSTPSMRQLLGCGTGNTTHGWWRQRGERMWENEATGARWMRGANAPVASFAKAPVTVRALERARPVMYRPLVLSGGTAAVGTEGQNPHGDQGESRQTMGSGRSSGGAHLSSLSLPC